MACSREWASRYTETMTIDERLDRLTERHEALTQTVELIAAELQTLRVLAQQDGENIRALVRIAENRERRLTEIEGGE
jgi:archaellum component FlaC